ncbi:hypothetical protein [Chromobacterium paludis]|uniref:Uncharacterized protein n=1 Tax=Chromobacterium paludis TaxID=2605945 RepID=A0A5C1DF07_9NEIS|nr:hypothetical protein [Chromobacterium paludis]QEL54208.1 hypothetical protein FYK34_00705 [Chromobacterium paludis]
MRPHLPHTLLTIRGEQLQHGSERWADLTLQGWQLLFDRQARRQTWRLLREKRLRAREALGRVACWLSGSLILLALAYLLYWVSARW